MGGWMDGWVYRWMVGWLDGWVFGWMNRWVDGWVAEWVLGCVDKWLGGWLGGWAYGRVCVGGRRGLGGRADRWTPIHLHNHLLHTQYPPTTHLHTSHPCTLSYTHPHILYGKTTLQRKIAKLEIKWAHCPCIYRSKCTLSTIKSLPKIQNRKTV